MKSIKLSAVMASMLGAGALLIAPVISNAATGQGWDAFNAGDGDRIVSQAYVGTSMQSAPAEGFDILNLDREVPKSGGYAGTSLSKPTGDSDAFSAGAM